MSYRFEPGRIYRMPTHFGPAPGPRQLPPELVTDPAMSPRRVSLAVSFLTDAARLNAHLPPRFSLAGEPVVTVELHDLTGVDWLAGRGYRMIHVLWPARFEGDEDEATGRFLAVVWENLADPIISGRDEIGHPKLYAAIAEPRTWNNVLHVQAEWMGFRFLDMSATDLADAPVPPVTTRSDGTLMLKYVPRTGDWGQADLLQATLSPSADPDRTIERYQRGSGLIRFERAAWSELPTMAHVVNALADLPVLEPRGASLVRSRGGKTYRDQRILR